MPDADWERRTFPQAVTLAEVDAPRATGGLYRTLEGRAVPFDVWAPVNPWLTERHAPGSLERSTLHGTGRGQPLLLFHDRQRWPIGLSMGWQNERDGLYGSWRLNETPDAQQAAELARSGELGYMSIGFLPQRDDWHDGQQDRDGRYQVTRLESRLLEVSLTPTPAWAEAQVTDVREAFVQVRQRPPARPDAAAPYREWLEQHREAPRP